MEQAATAGSLLGDMDMGGRLGAVQSGVPCAPDVFNGRGRDEANLRKGDQQDLGIRTMASEGTESRLEAPGAMPVLLVPLRRRKSRGLAGSRRLLGAGWICSRGSRWRWALKDLGREEREGEEVRWWQWWWRW